MPISNNANNFYKNKNKKWAEVFRPKILKEQIIILDTFLFLNVNVVNLSLFNFFLANKNPPGIFPYFFLTFIYI